MALPSGFPMGGSVPVKSLWLYRARPHAEWRLAVIASPIRPVRSIGDSVSYKMPPYSITRGDPSGSSLMTLSPIKPRMATDAMVSSASSTFLLIRIQDEPALPAREKYH